VKFITIFNNLITSILWMKIIIKSFKLKVFIIEESSITHTSFSKYFIEDYF
jgi:hypothetical protein